MKLYDYFRSTAAYRVRIALNYKKLRYDLEEIHLVNDGGEQHQVPYRDINPQGRVPTLLDGDDVLTQSLAIIEYLEEVHPQPALLPTDAMLRAKIRAFANAIACDIHPLNNLSVLQYLKNTLNVSDEQKNAWYAHWIEIGFAALEKGLVNSAGKYCFGNQLTLADLCLIPQVYNANRFAVPLDNYPTILRINENCLAMPAFDQAKPQT